MRDLIKVFLVGIIVFCTSAVYAGDVQKKTVLILPDNIVTESLSIDSFIYNEAAEFFSNEIINLLNKTDYIICPNVSEERQLLKSKPSYMIPAKKLTNKFKTSYNIDFPSLKKVAGANNQQYVLLLTSTLDSENYILRRTLWDFLNIPGATVIDPAYKINTYADLQAKAKEKKPDIKFNRAFNDAMKTVKADPKLCEPNYLDPHKRTGQKRDFYALAAVDVLIAEYERLTAGR